MFHWKWCSTEKGFRLISFYLNKILQMSKFKFFVSHDKFSRIAQIFLKFANVEHNWKIQKLKKNFCKIVERLVCLFVGEVEKLARLWNIGTPIWLIGTPLARWHVCWNVDMLDVEMKSWPRWYRPLWHAWHLWHAIYVGSVRYCV